MSTEKLHPGLRDLKEKIKEVMIPLLVEIFEAKLAAQQANMLPSRLHKPSSKSKEQIQEELQALLEQVKQLTLWVHGCELQILKALDETKDAPKPTFQYSISTPTPQTAEEKENPGPLGSLASWVKNRLAFLGSHRDNGIDDNRNSRD
jgi:hypothetical protein